MINVLQAVILTEGSKMIKTPTYHVFDMYKYHQDADLLDSTLETETVGLEEETWYQTCPSRYPLMQTA